MRKQVGNFLRKLLTNNKIARKFEIVNPITGFYTFLQKTVEKYAVIIYTIKSYYRRRIHIWYQQEISATV